MQTNSPSKLDTSKIYFSLFQKKNSTPLKQFQLLHLKVLGYLMMSVLMNSMLSLMILLTLLIIWVKFMINLRLLGRFLDP